MPQIHRTKSVRFNVEQMYKLVNDISSYPEFLPGCIGGRVISANESVIIAAVDIAKVGISKTFTTRNTLINNKSINMELVDGPFRKLLGDWQFTPLDDNTCKVELYLDFEFTNKLVEIMFGNLFKALAENMVQAFSQRAETVYHA
ncbi:polyketide cyclase/lipid transport protein [Candidatus Regiella insecticola LSR1]|uniref:Polyketide cyclase/lipid transport protein n=1 Tax=Candidatus Regiella insecticola LSR1 TaxID=663321 RepID=E0WRD7_9ENTR|nr:SRPBCC family protein [Candidatus Regiella insecticola]EFL92697.1 polyketide cyclase/lipid transport protein [Candidatus Regiella insecticola LSR1]